MEGSVLKRVSNIGTVMLLNDKTTHSTLAIAWTFTTCHKVTAFAIIFLINPTIVIFKAFLIPV